MRRFIVISVLLIFVSVLSVGLGASNTVADLYKEFKSAPDSTRTKVWWFHGETATTHEGITADLEAFRQAGVGGVVYYDQVHGDAKGAFPVFSAEWWDALKFSALEAKRLGLTFEINLSNGFVAGGPWITKSASMKRLCKSEVVVDGGSCFDGVLPNPSADEFWDVRVLAFPVPASVDWDEKVLVSERVVSEEPVMLSYDFEKPFTARALTYCENTRSKHPTASMNFPGPSADKFYGDGYYEFPPIGELEVSDDGKNWREVCKLPPLYNIHHKIKTISFPAVTGRYFRLNLHDWNRSDNVNHHPIELRSAMLSSKASVYEYEARAALVSEYIDSNPTPEYGENEIIDPDKVIDLTALMPKDGRLVWNVPDTSARWVVMRVAQTSTRGHVKHGRPGQMGLECDKMSREASELQWRNFAKVIIDTLSRYDLKPYGVVMDSHEMGAQNWTHGYECEFETYIGYDLVPYLPALFGYVIGSKEKSDSVLYDHRRTVAHLVNNRYFAYLDTLAMREGVMFTAQAMGNYQGMVTDNISVKGGIRRPQGEFWAKHAHGAYDIKESSSAAHIYGRQIASAEAYTDAKYSQSLAYLKGLADYAYADNLNEFVVCASAYQPWLGKFPGNTANGREYCLNRNNSMWRLSKGFWDYQSRCSFMMRQGKPVVDLCIYLGSELPVKLLAYRLPQIPEGYNWDVCTDDALMNVLSAVNGELQAADGMKYSVLVIEKDAVLTDRSDERIKQLVNAGVKVYDARKNGNFGLGLYLKSVGLAPDVDIISGNRPDDRVMFAHRLMVDNHVYFIANHSGKPWSQSVSFRGVKGNAWELWSADSGKRYSLDGRAHDGKVALSLAPYESCFVVVHNDTTTEVLHDFTAGDEERFIKPSYKWEVTYKLPCGAKTVKLDKFESWSENDDEDIRYHSGEAVYVNKFFVPSLIDKGERVYVRISGLHAVAKLLVNGSDVGYLWCAPWEVDITDYIKTGDKENLIEIEVANQLTNRMIGDMSLPEDERITFATTPIVKAGDKLLPAGITGGVDVYVR